MNPALRLLACLAPLGATASEFPWPDRGGPTFDGHVAAADARGLPTEWDSVSGKNIAWKIPLTGFGHSTPVIGAGRMWFTAATEDGREQFVYAVDPATGKILLHRKLFDNPDPEPLGGATGTNTYASPSCVVEPGAVYVHFGSYGTTRLDPATGEKVWERRDIHCKHFRGPGSSPVLFENLLLLTFDGIDRQFVTALDKATGKTVWLTPRTTDYKDLDKNGKPTLDGDLRKAYHTPLVVTVDGRAQMISVGSRAAFGYDARTGAEIWTIEHDDYNASSRPLVLPGKVFLHTGSRSANLIALRLDGTTRGNLTGSKHVLWDRSSGNSDLSGPVLVDGLIYMATPAGVLVCVDAANGEVVWSERLGGNFTPNLLVANGLVYALNREGVCHVVKAGRTFEKVAANKLAGRFMASPAAAGGALYFRSHEALYKVQAGHGG
jgi:outer membrane protein assembly factor BamB